MNFKKKVIAGIVLVFFGFQLFPMDNTGQISVRKKMNNYLLSMGAQKVSCDKSSDEYFIEECVICTINYDIDLCSISSISVFLDSDEKEKQSKKKYFYLPKYREFIKYFDKIHPLGKYIKDATIGVIPKRGWRIYTKVYKNARVLIKEENCEDVVPNLGCPIERFSIDYWMNLSGKVESKEIDEIGNGFGDSLFSNYTLNISGKKLIVTQKVYKETKIGNKVNYRVIRVHNRYITEQKLSEQLL